MDPNSKTTEFSTSLLLICCLVSTAVVAKPIAMPKNLLSESIMLMDSNSGQLIYSQGSEQRFQPASLVKILTLFLIFDALQQGEVQLDDVFVVSKKAAQKKGSTMYLKAGENVSLEMLIKGIAIVSGNDACVVVAEELFGGEHKMVAKMQQKLQQLKLVNSRFQTVDGWPAEEQYTTAHDMLQLTQAYIRQHPEALEYHHLKEFTHANIALHNRNGLVFKDPSVDGIKTGHVDAAGFHLVATAMRDQQRYITVVMGANSVEEREQDAENLLRYAFQHLQPVRLFGKNEIMTTLAVEQGTKSTLGLKAAEDGVYIVEKDKKHLLDYTLEVPDSVVAPIAQGQTLGHVNLVFQSEIIKSIPLLANDIIDLSIQQVRKKTKDSLLSDLLSWLNVRNLSLISLAVLFIFLSFAFIQRRNSNRSKHLREDFMVKQRWQKIFQDQNDRNDL